MRTVALIDYGAGNLRSAEKALRKVAGGLADSVDIVVTADPEVVAGADAVVLPGVGAFAACMAAVEARGGLVEAMTRAVRERGAPFLGICVGMQLLATRGLEFRVTAGLDWIGGEVRRLAPGDRRCKVPHMGWNCLDDVHATAMFADVSARSDMYFTHSFAFHPDDEADVAAWTEHGGRFPAAVLRDNLAGVQFHPEKSQAAGLRLLAGFLEWRP
jgi:glutamine amidotransferase